MTGKEAQTISITNPSYGGHCKVHGKQTNGFMIYHEGKYLGKYCMLCYDEWMKNHITPLTEEND